MRWLKPLTILFLGVGAMQLSAWSKEIMAGLVERKMLAETLQGQATLYLMVTAAFVGAALMIVGVRGLWQWVNDKSDLLQAWARHLEPVAGEYGRRVEIHPTEGLGFASMVDGVRTEVLVQPIDDAFVSVWVGAPGRQLVMILHGDSAGALVDDADWKLAGHHGAWVLRAELPNVARPLLGERKLVEAVDRLFARHYVRAVRHDHKGIEVIMDLMPAPELGDSVRTALTACRMMRRYNG